MRPFDINAGIRPRWAAAVVLAATVAACAPDLSIDPPARSQAQWIQLSQKVAFAPGQASLSAAAAREIDDFVRRAEVAYGDRIVVTAGPGGADRASRALAAARARVLTEYLARRRIPSRYAPGAPVAVGADEGAVVVGRYLVVAPDCPEWGAILAGGGLNAETDRFGPHLSRGQPIHDRPLGCVTNAALAAMVANPGDLVAPGPLGPGDGQFLSLGSRRYRAGKAKDVSQTKSTTTGENGSGQ